MLRRHLLILVGLATSCLATPDPGALVVMLNSEGAEVASTVTSAPGTYHLQAPAAGRFRLRAERIGFEDSTSGEIILLASSGTP